MNRGLFGVNMSVSSPVMAGCAGPLCLGMGVGKWLCRKLLIRSSQKLKEEMACCLWAVWKRTGAVLRYVMLRFVNQQVSRRRATKGLWRCLKGAEAASQRRRDAAWTALWRGVVCASCLVSVGCSWPKNGKLTDSQLRLSRMGNASCAVEWTAFSACHRSAQCFCAHDGRIVKVWRLEVLD